MSLATWDDVAWLPEDVWTEILAGRVYCSTGHRPREAHAIGAVGRFVGGPFDGDHGRGGPGGWWIFPGIDVQVSRHDVVRPDVSGWHRSRLSDADGEPFHVTPDWVCEILSPSTASRDRVFKRDLYARHGIGHYWLVDPLARTLEALELREGRWTEVGAFDDTAVARIPPFEAVEIPMNRLFLPRPPGADSEG